MQYLKKLHSLFFVGALFVLTSACKGDKDLQSTGTKAVADKPASTVLVSGNLNSVGSDTLNNLMTLWAESFNEIHPGVQIQIEGKGSSTAPPALIEGTAQLGPMSRAMKEEELDKFEKEFGYKPTQIRVALDALAVFVNKDNPVKGLSLKQIDSIFSSTYQRGGSPIARWGQVEGSAWQEGEAPTAWKNEAISLYGRNSASGTYGYFKKVALKKGDYKSNVKEQPGSSAVVQGIGSDLYGIGYSGIGYLTSGVRAIAISDGGELFEPTLDNCISGDYPLARFLYVYINKAPNKPLDELTRKFLEFVVSEKGQEIVRKDGYFALPEKIIEEELDKLN